MNFLGTSLNFYLSKVSKTKMVWKSVLSFSLLFQAGSVLIPGQFLAIETTP